MLNLILYNIESLEEPGINTNFLDLQNRWNPSYVCTSPRGRYKEQLVPTNFVQISTIYKEKNR